ncbi:hypothetical protein [Oleiagrimonas sp. MCCC 1A03011]|uniref:hypothetical protein n=1 Tax=Oleiagrimonas sp. MCCC 1A03011 TaxID=1926883 RepID=UPI000DC46A1F|nr:hypothetical protein [Oleiagrimonas sp. MCCC 1A03011]RAP59160.1 hypothetical protein BTJ49_00240 [Oleiagrimonas sp. MCCC 1A03011]
MKMHGRISATETEDVSLPNALTEVAIQACTDELRKTSAFLSAAASRMEDIGRAYGHEHLADRQPGFDHSGELIVLGPAASATDTDHRHGKPR